MSEPRLEHLFERFRRDGEAGALGEVFDATAGDLLRIARRLTRTRSEADDLVQATFLSAIERASTFDSTRALKPWLVGILVRQAGLERRRSARTREIEADPASKDAEPGDALAGREFAEALARALERLSPGEREVLIPLLLDERRAVEIARELEKRPDTVHMRIHRGLARLRKLLPAGFGLGFVATFLQRRALAHVKREVMHMARSSIGPSSIAASAAVASSSALAGFFLARKLALAALLATAVTVVVSVTRPWEALRPASPLGSLARTVPEAPPSAITGARESLSESRTGFSPASPSRSSAAMAATNPSKWVVKGRLNGLPDGETLTSTLKVEPLSPGMAIDGIDPATVGIVGARARSGSPPTPSVTAVVPSDGVFEVDVSSLFTADPATAPRELGLMSDHPRYLVAKARVLVEQGELVVGNDGQAVLELHQDLDLHLAAIVRGQVFAPSGSSATQCDMSIHRMNGEAPTLTAEDATSCVPGGEFRLRVAFGSSYLVLAFTEDSAPTTIPVVTAVGEERALPAIQLDAGLAISGTVTSGGTVGSGVRVVASSSNPPTMPAETVRAFFRWSAPGFVRIVGGCQTDALGRFTISGLSPGEFGVLAQGCAVPVQLTPVPTSQTPRVTVTAPAENVAIPLYCSVIEFHLVGVDPAPDEVSATIRDAGSDSFGFSAPWSPVQRVGFAPNREAHLSFRIEGCEPFDANYTFPGPGEQRVEVVQLVPISPATLRVHLTTQTGEPVAQAAFGFFIDPPVGGQGPVPLAFSREAQGEDGDFLMSAVRSGSYEVRVHTGGTFAHYAGYECESSFHVVLAPGEDETRAQTLTVGGRIRANVVTGTNQQSFGAKLLDAAGHECKTNFTHSDVGVEGDSSWTSSPGNLLRGANDTFPNLEPGEYRLQVLREAKTPLLLPVTVVAGRTNEITVDVDVP